MTWMWNGSGQFILVMSDPDYPRISFSLIIYLIVCFSFVESSMTQQQDHRRYYVVHGLLSQGYRGETTVAVINPWLVAVAELDARPTHVALRHALANKYKYHVTKVRVTGWTEVDEETAKGYEKDQDDDKLEPRAYTASDECCIL